MALESMTAMLLKAVQEGYAVGQFNLNNLEFTQAILQAAEEEKAPVIRKIHLVQLPAGIVLAEESRTIRR